MTDLAWSCRCGAMRGRVSVAPGSGTAVICHCDSCVRAQNHFGVPANTADGVAVFQTTPDRIVIDAGAEKLALAQLTPKGSYRWYAKCCNTQFGVTAATPRFPFFSAVQTVIETPEALPPVRTHVFVSKPGGGQTNQRLLPSLVAMLRRTIAAFWTGRWRQTPFFDMETRRPVREPELLPKDAGLTRP